MSAETKHIHRKIGRLWALLVLPLWLLGMPSVWAQVRPAQNPIVGSRLQRIVEMIPDSATDLPPYLTKSQDVYLLVTAGASYTDIQVLANPEVPPLTVARALSSALAGTPLRGQPVEWSADRYSAAQMSVHQAHFGATHGSNTVPVGLLMSGLRQAGLTPHLLLRIPTYARTASVPVSHYGTRTFRWYDAHRLGKLGTLTITAQIGWISLYRVLAYYLAIPALCGLGLWSAHFLSGRGNRDNEARRRLFRRLSTGSILGAFAVHLGAMFYLIRTPTPAALADLWLGSSVITPLLPFLVGGAAVLAPFLLMARKQEIRSFGSFSRGPAIPMSDEEKAVRKRIAQWNMIPHLIGAVALGAVPFFVHRTSPLYPYIHPVAMILPAFGGILVALILQKRLNRFAKKTKDDDLTWRARQIGQLWGVRMSDVFVEDSSGAAHLAFASHQGHHITLSRKLQETFTPAETDFILAHHLACMKRKPRLGGAGMILLIMFLPLLIVPPVLLWAVMPTASGTLLLAHSLWIAPAAIGYMLMSTLLMPLVSKASAHQRTKNETEADHDALEATADLTAAMGALGKLGMNPVIAMMHANGSFSSEIASKAETAQVARLVSRRETLQASALRFAPAPGAVPEISPFSLPKTDNQGTDNIFTQ